MCISCTVPVGFVGACGDDDGACPTETGALTDAEVDVYRQLEVCASRVTGVTLHRDDLPRVELDPETVACSSNNFGRCVTTAAGQAVTGFYLQDCDTCTVVDRLVLLHEMLHRILCEVSDLECDPAHTSPAWVECQQFKGCPTADGGVSRILLAEKVCDGTEDCDDGADEKGCD